MAKAKKQKSLEETLWGSANKLRGTVESSEYKHIVLGLIFLKFVSDTFEDRREQLIKESKEALFINQDTLFSRITPCLENAKTAYVNGLNEEEVTFGSTEFIVISFYWVYYLAKKEKFRTYSISSMSGSSERQRVHSDYLKEYDISADLIKINEFHHAVEPMFVMIDLKSKKKQ